MTFLLLTSCGNQAETIQSLGNAFVGSQRLRLYQELEATAKVTGELEFGQPVRLLQRRRNFYYVRGGGLEGWTHRANLFNERQVREMRALAQFAEGAPAQGEARVFATLNVHNQPNRSAPTIFQIVEEERVTVLAHERHARVPYDPGPLVEASELTRERPSEKSESAASPEDEAVALPQPPETPGLPGSWLRLSGLTPARIAAITQEGFLDDAPGPATPSAGELWTLVRNKSGLAGWALQARLIPGIPDAVAQYSEGALITSYFALAPASADGSHYHWLWTTLKTPGAAFDFDSYRVFIWNNRLHRFETSFIARDVEGYLPVEVTQAEDGTPHFRITVRERGGLTIRKTYELNGVRTRLLQSVPWPNYNPLRQPPIMSRLPEQPSFIPPSVKGDPGFWENAKGAVSGALSKVTGN